MTEQIREYLSTEQRSLPLEHTIDPGFVNRRAVETVIGRNGMSLVDEGIRSVPEHLPAGLREARIHHVYNRVMLDFCTHNGIHTLSDVLTAGKGHMFCSTETVLPCPSLYESNRVQSEVKPAGESAYRVVLEYSTEHVRSDTLRSELHQGAIISVIAIFQRKENETLFFRPLVMGNPWLRSEDPKWADSVMWWNRDFYEHFVEDFDEFGRVRDVEKPASIDIMEKIPERGIKRCIAKLLGDRTVKDWGGELSDHFTSNIHLNGTRTTAAFLLKGPAKWSPMTLAHLGKNNDQIFRLAQEPAQVLIVQHSHDISTAVRATLRAFAVQPGNPRRYCLIDGRDTLWLLEAYGLLEEALNCSGH